MSEPVELPAFGERGRTVPAAPPPPAEPERAPAPALEALPAPRYDLVENADGSAVVKLHDPVRFNGEDIGRLTIPRICGRHMRSANWNLFERPTLGQAMAWANDIVEPVGVLDELEANLARDLAMEVSLILVKKSRSTGARR